MIEEGKDKWRESRKEGSQGKKNRNEVIIPAQTIKGSSFLLLQSRGEKEWDRSFFVSFSFSSYLFFFWLKPSAKQMEQNESTTRWVSSPSSSTSRMMISLLRHTDPTHNSPKYMHQCTGGRMNALTYSSPPCNQIYHWESSSLCLKCQLA